MLHHTSVLTRHRSGFSSYSWLFKLMSELCVELMSVQRSFRGHRSGYFVCVCGCLCLRGNVHTGADCTVPLHTKVGLMWTNTIYSDLCLDSWGQGYWEASLWLLCVSRTIDVYAVFLLFPYFPPSPCACLFTFIKKFNNLLLLCVRKKKKVKCFLLGVQWLLLTLIGVHNPF